MITNNNQLIQNFINILACPQCNNVLTYDDELFTLICKKNSEHRYPINNFGFFEFAVKQKRDKYDDEEYSEAYLGDAFGYRFVNCSESKVFIGTGQPEGLYRTIAHMTLSTIQRKYCNNNLRIVDVACGVGRCLVDVADCFPNASLMGFDYSKQMVKVAKEAICGEGQMRVNLTSYGFGRPYLNRMNKSNIFLAQADARKIPVRRAVDEKGIDIVINSMLVDRLYDSKGVEDCLDESVAILKKHGTLIFASPFNWVSRETWKKYKNHRSMVLEYLIKKHQLVVEEAFDGLVYRENLDPHGGHLELPVLVVKAIKP